MDNDGVALTDILSVNLVDVVKRCTGNGRAGNHNRIKLRHRRKHARSSHLNANLTKYRLFFFRWKLKCYCPTWRTRRKSKLFLIRKGINLNDHAIDIVVKLGALLKRTLAKVMHLLCTYAPRRVGVDAKAAVSKP